MTDHETDPRDDARAEAALAEAFGRVDHLDTGARVDASAIRRRAKTRARARVGGSALAVLLVAGGIVGGVQLAQDDDPGTFATQTPINADGPAPDGSRYDYFGDVRVTVPQSWDYDNEPGSDWCVDNGKWLPDRPYIDLGGPDAVMSIGCPPTNGDEGFSNEPPTDLWVTHLTVLPKGQADGDDGATQVGDWWVLRDQVGSVMVKAVSKDRAEAESLLATAVVVDDGASGCLNHSPIQDAAFPRPDPAFDVTALADVDTITVCQYGNLDDATAVGLVGRAILTGADADAVLAALQAAPAGGGPDRPENCMPDDPGDTAIELHLDAGGEQHSMFVFYSTCHGNGFDDGTTLRELTKQGCQPLMRMPVRITSGSSASFERCYPDD